LTRSTFPLVYQGRLCTRHRCIDRLVDTDECLDCVGPRRLREMQDAEENRSRSRRVHRLLHELSDGGKTTLQLAETSGLTSFQVRGLLEELASTGVVSFGEERLGHHRRWLWSLSPRSVPAVSRGASERPRAKNVVNS
jgi:hypothetical protein